MTFPCKLVIPHDPHTGDWLFRIQVLYRKVESDILRSRGHTVFGQFNNRWQDLRDIDRVDDMSLLGKFCNGSFLAPIFHDGLNNIGAEKCFDETVAGEVESFLVCAAVDVISKTPVAALTGIVISTLAPDNPFIV